LPATLSSRGKRKTRHPTGAGRGKEKEKSYLSSPNQKEEKRREKNPLIPSTLDEENSRPGKGRGKAPVLPGIQEGNIWGTKKHFTKLSFSARGGGPNSQEMTLLKEKKKEEILYPTPLRRSGEGKGHTLKKRENRVKKERSPYKRERKKKGENPLLLSSGEGNRGEG